MPTWRQRCAEVAPPALQIHECGGTGCGWLFLDTSRNRRRRMVHDHDQNRIHPTGVATGRVDPAPTPGPEQEHLNAIVGRWINEGHTINPDGTQGVKILAIDVYDWAPGGFFVIHHAYGRIGDIGVGGVEIIGYDRETQKHQVYFFDSQGNVSRHELTLQNRTWIWQGDHTRCTGVFSEDGKTQSAHHERSDDGGVNWVPSMVVTLRKVD